MWRAYVLLALLAISAFAANVRLYLKDGSSHVVSEYKVLSDRVRFYSVERSQWEEIPLELVDLKKTEAVVKKREEEQRAEAQVMDAEEKAERDLRNEVERVPRELGVYLVQGEQVKPVKQAESKIQNNKRRSILKVIAPIPVISGKSTVELDGVQSATVVTKAQPEFYIRLSAPERFGIIKLTPGKGVRVVEKLEIVPVSNEIVETMESVDVFRHQVEEDVYKIWPVKPLESGEYAVVQYTDGKANAQVWDFSYRPQGSK